MDFKKRLKELTVKGALKKHYTKGVEFKFKHMSDGHKVEGSLSKGSAKYEGTWFGSKLTKEMNTSGVRKYKLVRKQFVAGQEVKLQLDYATQAGMNPMGTLKVGLDHVTKKDFMGRSHQFGQKHTVNLDFAKREVVYDDSEGDLQWFQGFDHQLRYASSDGGLGMQFDFSTFQSIEENMFQAKKLSGWSKMGKHTFMVDTTWNSDFSMKEMKLYSQTQLDDNWKVAMMMKPKLDWRVFQQQDSLLEVGLTGKLSDNTSCSVVADDKKNVTVSGIYKPTKNVDLVVTNKFTFDDENAGYNFNKSSLKPSFTLSVHD